MILCHVVSLQFIADYLRDDCVTETETCMFLNLVLAFVWREWRDTEEMKDFFLKKMNSEFQDLLQNRTAGKVVEQITIQDFFLGTSLPVIKGKALTHSAPAPSPFPCAPSHLPLPTLPAYLHLSPPISSPCPSSPAPFPAPSLC